MTFKKFIINNALQIVILSNIRNFVYIFYLIRMENIFKRVYQKKKLFEQIIIRERVKFLIQLKIILLRFILFLDRFPDL